MRHTLCEMTTFHKFAAEMSITYSESQFKPSCTLYVSVGVGVCLLSESDVILVSQEMTFWEWSIHDSRQRGQDVLMRGKHELAHDLLKPINVYPGGELGCWVLWTVDRGREAQGKYKVSSLKIKAHSSEKCYNEVFQHLSQM